MGISPVTTPPGPRTAPAAPAAPAAPPAPPPSPARAVPVVVSKANPPETIGKLTERMELLLKTQFFTAFRAKNIFVELIPLLEMT